ncbi:DUF6985 domain-containing protein [Desulforhopalus sp. 52FAK]
MYNVNPSKYPKTNVDEYFKYTSTIVDGFAGLQIRNGMYGSVSSSEASDGEVHFCCDKELDTELFLSIVNWVDANGKELLETSLKSFVEQYWEMRDLVIESLIDEDPDEVVPEISSFADLAKLCGIVAIHVKGSGTRSEPRFGIEFGCTWEDEHGAGVSFSGLKVIESGQGSEAFDFE